MNTAVNMPAPPFVHLHYMIFQNQREKRSQEKLTILDTHMIWYDVEDSRSLITTSQDNCEDWRTKLSFNVTKIIVRFYTRIIITAVLTINSML